jgi:hypothetical protein
LDRLTDAGISPAEVLAQLPADPVVSAERLRQAAGQLAIPTVLEQDLQTRQLDLVEYAIQLERLLAGADSCESAADLFLRAVGVVIACQEMAVYLREEATDRLVVAAAIERDSGLARRPQFLSCRAEPGGVVHQAFAAGRPLMECDRKIEPVHDGPDAHGSLALPLFAASGRPLGIWLARLGYGHPPAATIRRPLHMMHLLAPILAGRLESTRRGSCGADRHGRDARAPTVLPLQVESVLHRSAGT